MSASKSAHKKHVKFKMNAVRLTRNGHGHTSIFSPILEVKHLPNIPESVAVFKEYNLKRLFKLNTVVLEAICQKVNYSKKPMTW